jgi:hypothetical protein
MLDWYSAQADKWEWWVLRLHVFVLILSSLVTVVAAIPLALNHSKNQPWVQLVVVILSALTTLVSGLLYKSGIERTAQLREQGRVTLATLRDKAILRLTMMQMTDKERLAYLERILDVTQDVEQKCGIHPIVASARAGRFAEEGAPPPNGDTTNPAA